MPAPRPLLTAVAGTALLLTVAGCQKPSPGVTLVSADRSVHAEAVQYCRGGRFLTKANGNECPGTGKAVTVLRVRQGDTVGVDVDKKLADTGWYLYDTDRQQSLGFQDTHYATLVADFANRPLPGVVHLEVREIDHKPKNDKDLPKVLGQWRFQLVVK
jgi:hypothetical protein